MALCGAFWIGWVLTREFGYLFIVEDAWLSVIPEQAQPLLVLSPELRVHLDRLQAEGVCSTSRLAHRLQ